MATLPGDGRRRWTPRLPAPDEPGGGPQDAGAATPASGASMSDNELREAAFLGVRWFAVTQAIAQITTLAAALVLGRLISPADFGRLAIAIIASGFSVMFST